MPGNFTLRQLKAFLAPAQGWRSPLHTALIKRSSREYVRLQTCRHHQWSMKYVPALWAVDLGRRASANTAARMAARSSTHGHPSRITIVDSPRRYWSRSERSPGLSLARGMSRHGDASQRRGGFSRRTSGIGGLHEITPGSGGFQEAGSTSAIHSEGSEVFRSCQTVSRFRQARRRALASSGADRRRPWCLASPRDYWRPPRAARVCYLGLAARRPQSSGTGAGENQTGMAFVELASWNNGILPPWMTEPSHHGFPAALGCGRGTIDAVTLCSQASRSLLVAGGAAALSSLYQRRNDPALWKVLRSHRGMGNRGALVRHTIRNVFPPKLGSGWLHRCGNGHIRVLLAGLAGVLSFAASARCWAW